MKRVKDKIKVGPIGCRYFNPIQNLRARSLNETDLELTY